jgi:sorbitol-specific phosphotransferase system component IIC
VTGVIRRLCFLEVRYGASTDDIGFDRFNGLAGRVAVSLVRKYKLLDVDGAVAAPLPLATHRSARFLPDAADVIIAVFAKPVMVGWFIAASPLPVVAWLVGHAL